MTQVWLFIKFAGYYRGLNAPLSQGVVEDIVCTHGCWGKMVFAERGTQSK